MNLTTFIHLDHMSFSSYRRCCWTYTGGFSEAVVDRQPEIIINSAKILIESSLTSHDAPLELPNSCRTKFCLRVFLKTSQFCLNLLIGQCRQTTVCIGQCYESGISTTIRDVINKTKRCIDAMIEGSTGSQGLVHSIHKH